jgi:hypothetical protein
MKRLLCCALLTGLLAGCGSDSSKNKVSTEPKPTGKNVDSTFAPPPPPPPPK